MKKVLKITLLSIMSLLLFVGCAKPSPTKTVEKFFTEIKECKNEDMNKYVDLNGQMEKLSEKYEGYEPSPELTSSMTSFFNKFEATILDETITDDTAIVNAEINAPNFTTVISEYIKEALSKAFTSAFLGDIDAESPEMLNEFENILATKLNEATAEKRTVTFNLTKQNNEWIINPDEKLYYDILGVSNLGGLDTSSLGL